MTSTYSVQWSITWIGDDLMGFEKNIVQCWGKGGYINYNMNSDAKQVTLI
jgi:hypothetical protein